ncbi:sodium:proton antiporter [Desulfovibrio sp. X2]|uniref:cation:proton antiporter n=1 Tax=Desulfovibrio sp. X2 TaxID=941449 RepID=UPI00040F9554|nr:cation:proton antiporter [Desulfovibrio sp. X2]
MELHALGSVSLALVLGVTGYIFAKRLSLPAILFYLLAGLAAGPLGAGLVRSSDLGDGLLPLVEFAVAIILFEGGLLLSTRGFLQAPKAIARLLSVTIAITAAGGTLLARFVLGLSWDIALLFGVMAVVTGPSVIGPLLKSLSFPPRLRALLHWESIWGDVIGVVLSAVALKFASLADPATQAGELATGFLLALCAGAALGALGGLFLSRMVLPLVETLHDEGLPGVAAFAVAMGTFVLSGHLVPNSGPIAVAVAGFFLAHQKPRTLAAIRHFKDQLAAIVVGTLFVLLSATVDPGLLAAQWPRMLLVAAGLGIVVRPVAVAAALAGTEVPARERLYAAVVSPRGIVCLASAAYAGLVMPSRGHEAVLMLDTIFMVVLLSGSWATLMGGPLASLLKVRTPPETSGIILVGLNPFSRAVARALAHHVPVVFVDPRADRCEEVRTQGERVFCAEVLAEDIYEEAFNEGYGRLLCLSRNDALNMLVAGPAARQMGAGHVWQSRAVRPEKAFAQEVQGLPLAFPPELVIGEAADAVSEGRGRVEELGCPPGEAPGGAKVVPLFRVTHDGRGVQVVTDAADVAGTEGRCLCYLEDGQAFSG